MALASSPFSWCWTPRQRILLRPSCWRMYSDSGLDQTAPHFADGQRMMVNVKVIGRHHQFGIDVVDVGALVRHHTVASIATSAEHPALEVGRRGRDDAGDRVRMHRSVARNGRPLHHRAGARRQQIDAGRQRTIVHAWQFPDCLSSNPDLPPSDHAASAPNAPPIGPGATDSVSSRGAACR